MKRTREDRAVKKAPVSEEGESEDEEYDFRILNDESDREAEDDVPQQSDDDKADGSIHSDADDIGSEGEDALSGASPEDSDGHVGSSGGDFDDEEGEGGDDEDDEEDEDEENDDEEDSEDAFMSSDDDDEEGSWDRGEQRSGGPLRVLRRKPRPEIEAEYASDSSDEETTNTVGNVPKEWYEDFDHMGYDVKGNKIVKPVKGDELDQFLTTMDDPNAWRTVHDPVEGKDIILSNQDLEMLKQIQSSGFPDGYDPYQPTVEWFTSKTQLTSLNSAPEPKRRFVPSKLEGQRIMYIARGIQSGRIVPGRRRERQKPKYFSIWDETDEPRQDHPMHIAAPKLPPPEHMESYNPPAEYLFTPDEQKQWQETDAEDRLTNFMPKKYPNLRSVPGYDRFIQERFDRCLDLYLCPRIIKKKVNIDPESLIPKLPSPKDLRPFPTTLAITYRGHTGRVRAISIDPTGQWLVSGSDDSTVRVWEISTGRCLKTWTMEEAVQFVTWNPNKTISLVAVATQARVLLIELKLGGAEVEAATDAIFEQIWTLGTPANGCEWSRPSASDQRLGIRAQITFAKTVTFVAWHRKGDYFATVSPAAASTSVLIHQLSKRQTQNPFRKSKGLVQRVLFHPSKPFLFVATQRNVRVYNLLKQELSKVLQSGAKWISSIDVHPSGDNVIIGTYDKRVSWFDMDLSTKPYKTLR
ncbi:Ribosome biogenesis protein erb1 [Rhizophlyctis rosea]|uniref:Ribosome biogenesis protein ERB1 n=1 Tax=Rhizophlyctis rosea TaxID=64517 RepID=A0AAD5SG69_9FUNG|nr:Ribosome biogenesis protein erb1 [Rhizophlyctis rosea]